MVERRSELKRRYHRKEKMAKLKAKLAAAKNGGEKDVILKKIHILSPWWIEPVAANFREPGIRIAAKNALIALRDVR